MNNKLLVNYVNIPGIDWLYLAGVMRNMCHLNEYDLRNSFSKTITKIEKFDAKLYWYREDFKAVQDEIFGKILEDIDAGLEYNRAIEEATRHYDEVSKRVEEQDLSILSDDDLADVWDRLIASKEKPHILGLITTYILDEDEQPFTRFIIDLVVKKIKESGKKFDINDLVFTLTTPEEDSEVKKEEIAELEFYLNHESNPKKIERKELEDFAKRYGWLSFQYLGPSKTAEEYRKFFEGFYTDKIDAEKKLHEFQTEKENLQKRKKKIFSELKFSQKEKKYTEFACKIMKLKDSRKASQYYGSYIATLVLSEIAKRMNLDLQLLRQILPWDLKDVFLIGKFDKDELRRRYEYAVLICDEKQDIMLSDEEAKKYFESQKFEQINTDVKEIKGFTACPGKAKGAVQIVNKPEDIKDFQNGNILVSIATYPALVPAMKKAAAIVTNEGGLTSHAAIISRELGIPCIVGTKVAANILKNGDIVNVNANEGIVKIISHQFHIKMNDKFENLKWFQKSNRQRMSPFPNYLSMEGVCKEMKDYFGFAYEAIMIHYKENMQTVFMSEEDELRMEKEVFQDLNKNPELLAEQVRIIESVADDFLPKLEKISKEKLENYKNENLVELFQFYASNYKKIYPRYFLVIACENILIAHLQKILESKIKDQKILEEYFTILTTEPKAMVNLREETDRMEIIREIQTNKIWSDIFNRRTIEDVLNGIDGDTELKKILKDHEKKFFWITRDYEDPILTYPDIVAKVWKTLSDRKKYQEIKKKVESGKRHSLEVEKIEKKLQLSTEEKALFRTMRDGIFLKEKRKEIVSKSLYFFDAVLNEASRRTGLSIKLVRFVKIDEIEELLNNEIKREVIESRFRASFWLMSKSGTEVLIDEEAKSLEEKYLNFEKVDVLEGLPISGGFVKGTAKIMMNPEEGSKVSNGDIIVTVQAVPSFGPTISRAAGIIADGGTGITSHTATLAREAKIPGITGLKIATKVINDGDLISINGSTGVVEIIKRKE